MRHKTEKCKMELQISRSGFHFRGWAQKEKARDFNLGLCFREADACIKQDSERSGPN